MRNGLVGRGMTTTFGYLRHVDELLNQSILTMLDPPHQAVDSVRLAQCPDILDQRWLDPRTPLSTIVRPAAHERAVLRNTYDTHTRGMTTTFGLS